MATHKRAGLIAEQKDLVNIPKLVSLYYSLRPNVEEVSQRVCFGTSGHRGSALSSSFNEAHIVAIAQAVADYRKQANITGQLILGIDTHALSQPAAISVIEVLVANGVNVVVHQNDGFTPTPVVSHAIICANKTAQATGLVDGLIVTPSHNPPQDGGIKYNPPHGGPAEGEITTWIQDKANDYLANNLIGVQQISYQQALASELLTEQDLITPYVEDLENVIDMQAIANAKIKLGVDPLGGSGIAYWQPIARHYGIDITVVNNKVDPSFAFMPLDKDGKIRMDCSSSYAMAGLLAHKDSFDLCLGNDPDYDRHGIVCPGSGLMNPNHFLAVAIDYLVSHRPEWTADMVIGKTLVSSAMIDKVCALHGKQMAEVPVGFKWFVDGLANSEFAFGGEESAGAAFLRKDGSTWCTDKDGFILCLLAAEMLAVTGKTPQQRYDELEAQFGKSYYQRIDSPVSLEDKAKFSNIKVDSISADNLAGDSIVQKLTHAPGNNAAIGGIKVVTEKGWFAARPSGTEALFKLYAESFVSEAHLARLIEEAQLIVAEALK
ncbi:phosphoglucomutase (alpha-D-glucose-1,6-bisphosphate-dependent) [Shewanella fidelis]|uniref:Phosphoglucomutase n=1 Tax=Shewanella fidelis TaxID=173509 RepID=A0AAW8NLZ4_9GAMM|nr:phosphoglucomutase (alpha-D-glucose-1,6-bisphosphate-dependent) [Shewanella fidelis]MDR8523897.1 phosphoglucomutase (alpha-D-glucose-1,6-bisphosphate-dependent) [Shewanella fidelis]MDW4810444.1 phosphoglucomutase (alpha-D-glucose-1,6-bisphosphate-dependent) [Shewanella fidelis]MDW4814565.1 phosphoglucomutase (alpha-D-glucose-1,6-bisphosphate-dependent) [Shewanella fidelis]MDW4818655.1 phosphoglucomutase (alpha-D-glucose-1,6-bisphosphate-dependent) [Shewanella fidelis]MDW4823668.1 phosphoglu